EYHGPTLNYLTLVPAWLSGAHKLTQVSEFTVRIVPVFFGVLLVLLVLLLADGLGRSAAVVAAVFTAVSPAFVFYSRYYIQEMLLVCFTFGVITCGWRYVKSRNVWWAVGAGIFLGLCHATKETCIIIFGSMAMAGALTLIVHRWRGGLLSDAGKIVKAQHLPIALVTALIVSGLFYSSFFSNPAGILDSFRTYATYFNRASENQLHIHPCYYYLRMLLYSKYASGPLFTEAIIVILGVVGFVAAMTKKQIGGVNSHLLTFLAFYTLIMTIVYSAIPYKTPWCMLGFLHGMILLAGVGAVVLVRSAPNVLPRLILLCLLVEASLHLAWQVYQANYKFYADSRNPYVYAHPTTDVFAMAQRVREIARVNEHGSRMQIHVICPGDDYWPLPWYLRDFHNVGYWNEVTNNVTSASLIIASVQIEQQLLETLWQSQPREQKTLYMCLFDRVMALRPQVELRGYVPFELWSRFQQHQSQTTGEQ
ncbi:MAG: flippase activity-associated protein Agl23, partial [Planctomycetota bacterium]